MNDTFPAVVRGPDGLASCVGRDESRVRLRDPATGREWEVAAEACQSVDLEPLAFVARVLDGGRGGVGTDERTIGLLAELVDRGPTPARTVVRPYDACESDLQGMLAETRAAGLVAETRVAGLPGYEATDDGRALVERRRKSVWSGSSLDS